METLRCICYDHLIEVNHKVEKKAEINRKKNIERLDDNDKQLSSELDKLKSDKDNSKKEDKEITKHDDEGHIRIKDEKRSSVSVCKGKEKSHRSRSKDNKRSNRSKSKEIKSSHRSRSKEVKSSHQSKSKDNKKSHRSKSKDNKKSHRSKSKEIKSSHGSKSRDVKSSHGSKSRDVKSSHGSKSRDVKSSHGSKSRDVKSTHGSKSRDIKSSNRSKSKEIKKSHRSKSREKKRSHRSKSKENKSSHRSKSKEKKRSQRSKSKEKRKSHRSRSKDRKKREEKSPDLKSTYKYWDVPPTGYETVQPAEFKALQASGQAIPNMYTTEGNTHNSKSADTQVTMGTFVSRQNRRIYIGNLPLGVTEEGMTNLFNEHLNNPDAVIAVQVNVEKNFAFAEFRSVEETSHILTIEGIEYNGFPLKLKRPRDFVAMGTDSSGMPAISSYMRSENPHKLFVGCLPHYLTEEQVREILVNFGALSGFNLVRDANTGLSKGYAFCEYADHSVTEKACIGLTGLELGDKRLVVQPASDSNRNSAISMAVGFIAPRPSQLMDTGSVKETEVLCLYNMIGAEDLEDDDEYEGIVEDVREECSKYGTVRGLRVPRSGCDDVGKVYVEFAQCCETAAALKALAGRSFGGRVVVASFYDPDKYRSSAFF